MRSMRISAGLSILLWSALAQAAAPPGGMVEFTLRGQRIEGTPLDFNARQVHLLGRDGRLWEFKPSEASSWRKSDSRFRPLSISEFRAALLRELGRRFEVSGTSHYVVAHPVGKRDLWAQRFEDLYRSFVHYWRVRGLTVEEPAFPLVGVVCDDRRQFDELSQRNGNPVGAGVLGYYEPDSNRIMVYDAGSAAGGKPWRQNASVVIHEATHQTAFNTGVHSRYAQPPRWVAEGLATMFEAPGVYDSQTYREQSDRINRGRLDNFRQLAPRHNADWLAGVLLEDRLFRINPGAAYAEAWALTFYLVETQPRKYAEYLARCGQQRPFAPYTAAQRQSDFAASFGSDLRMIEAGLLRFIGGLK